MIFSIRHSGTRYLRDCLVAGGHDFGFGKNIEHLNFVDQIEEGCLVLMRDPDKTLLCNFRDPWRTWERTLHMLWESLKPLEGATYTRFRIDYDPWSVLEDWVGGKVPKSGERWSSGRYAGHPSEGWDWVEMYAKSYYGERCG